MTDELGNPTATHYTGLTFVVALLLVELLFIGFTYDALILVQAPEGTAFTWLADAGSALKVVLAMIAALLLGLGPRLLQRWQELNAAHAIHQARYFIASHVGAFLILWWASHQVFGEAAQIEPPPAWMPAIWLAAVPVVVVTWLLAMAPFSFWRTLTIAERHSIGMAFAIGPLALIIALTAQTLWAPFSEMTLKVSAWLLSQVYSDITLEYDSAILGGQSFAVRIGQECSGYEGVGLVTIFTAIYLSIYRRDFRFPNALVLFPLGIVTIWLFNAVRIVALIIIGEEISPEIAVGGFHSQAGWIMFIIVAISILLSADKWSFVTANTRNKRKESLSNDGRIAIALLTPLIVLLGSTLLTQAFSADHDWLYPLRVVATGGAIVWSLYYAGPLLPRSSLSVWPLLAGIVVFGLWLLLVPTNIEQDRVTSAALNESSGWLVVTWFIFRFIGSVLTVPIAEELAFRGYVLGRLSGGRLSDNPRFSWVALIGSSVVFGLLHSAWLAGIAAGLVYGFVRYQRGSLADAIIAHAVTNLLLSLYVLGTGAWSLW